MGQSIHPTIVAKAHCLIWETYYEKVCSADHRVDHGLRSPLLDRQLLEPKEGVQIDNSPKRPQVVIAKRSVEAGEVLTEDDLALGEISSDAVPETVFKSPSELIGRVPVVPLIQGQAIVATLLAPKGMGPGLQATVPIGMCSLLRSMSSRVLPATLIPAATWT